MRVCKRDCGCWIVDVRVFGRQERACLLDGLGSQCDGDYRCERGSPAPPTVQYCGQMYKRRDLYGLSVLWTDMMHKYERDDAALCCGPLWASFLLTES